MVEELTLFDPCGEAKVRKLEPQEVCLVGVYEEIFRFNVTESLISQDTCLYSYR